MLLAGTVFVGPLLLPSLTTVELIDQYQVVQVRLYAKIVGQVLYRTGQDVSPTITVSINKIQLLASGY